MLTGVHCVTLTTIHSRVDMETEVATTYSQVRIPVEERKTSHNPQTLGLIFCPDDKIHMDKDGSVVP